MIDLQELQKRFDNYINSPEFEENIKIMLRKKEIEKSQIKRLNSLSNFEDFINKVLKKYSSEQYRNRYYFKGIIPPESLLFLIHDCAEKYGKKCNKKEWVKYSNPFTTSLYLYKGYYILRMDGQGSSIDIIKK